MQDYHRYHYIRMIGHLNAYGRVPERGPFDDVWCCMDDTLRELCKRIIGGRNDGAIHVVLICLSRPWVQVRQNGPKVETRT